MPVTTRLQARAEQTSELVSSLRAYPPRRSGGSRQGNAVVNSFTEVGTPSSEMANGVHLTDTYNVAPCGATLCKTCDILVTHKTYTSNVTNKIFAVKNHSGENLSCKSQNLIYLLSCKNCNLQYVGETILPLNKRMNIHRTSKKGCPHVIDHFKEVCTNTSFSIQIITKFVGNGYDNLDKMDEEMHKIRQQKEDDIIKTIRVIYPYGLNIKAKNKNSQGESKCVGILFPPLPRRGDRPIRSHMNRNFRESAITRESFFDKVKKCIDDDIAGTFNYIRKLLNQIKKKELKGIASTIMLQPELLYKITTLHQCYEYILDIIDTKLFKVPIEKVKNIPRNVCVVYYENKGLDDINLSKILNCQEVLINLPKEMEAKENNPIITYRLSSTIRNKIFNYKQTLESLNININGEINIPPCECQTSNLCDNNLGHIITGKLEIVKNGKLRKLLTKGPNYREPKCLNYGKCLNEIKKALDIFCLSMVNKYKLRSELDIWKESVLEKVKEKVLRFRYFKKTQKTSPALKNYAVLEALLELQNKFVMVPIDKAANNVAFICKRYYIQRLLSEVGIMGLPSDTYKISNCEPENVILNNVILGEKIGLKIDDTIKKLPSMYWIPKMHKTPIGARFIVASKTCSTKPISKAVSNVFSLIYNQIHRFHMKSKFYSNVNLFWVVKNSMPVKEKLDIINTRKRAKSIATYDFSTLYTKIPHDDLIKELNKIIDLAFAGGTSKYIGFTNAKAFWSKSIKGKTYFTSATLKKIVGYLIGENYFKIGNKLFKQVIGIQMGLDPAPFWANLYLHRHEYIFMSSLIRNDIRRARLFLNCSRFIDDLITINDLDEFGKSHNSIYPKELELKCEHSGLQATFLDLDIRVENGQFVYKLFDKRDSFPFHIVRMPFKSSNIPAYIFYGSVLSEYLRIARATLRFIDFIPKIVTFVSRMIRQGGKISKIFKQLNKAMNRHSETFRGFQVEQSEIIKAIKDLVNEAICGNVG